MAESLPGALVYVGNNADAAIPVVLTAGSVSVNLAANVGLLNAAEAEINPATSDLQTTGNAILTTIDADTSALAAAASGAEILIAGGATQTNDLKVTLDSEVVAVDATGQGDVPITLDGETVAIDNTSDIKVTLDSEAVVLGASDGTDIGNVDVASLPADTFVAEEGALGKGVLLQGDDGTDRHNVAVDASGRVQVDIAEQSDGTALAVADSTVEATLTNIEKCLGATAPTVDSFTTAAISAAANTANQSIVAAPGASKQIWVMHWYGSADTGDGSISWQDEDDTALSGVMEIYRKAPMGAKSDNFAMPVMKVATNKALELDTVTCGFKGTIGYAIVSV